MKLINRNQSVPGGFFYIVPETNERVSTTGSFDTLINSVYGYYQVREIQTPAYLENAIEDQLCSRLPSKYCRYTRGLGDLISQGVSVVAGAVDTVFGTEFKEKARSCGSCARRRQALNKISR